MMGVNVTVEVEVEVAERALASCGICFMMVRMHHSSMRHVGPARVDLGTRSIFNLLEQRAALAVADRIEDLLSGSGPPPFQDGVCVATTIKAISLIGAPARPQGAGKREAI